MLILSPSGQLEMIIFSYATSPPSYWWKWVKNDVFVKYQKCEISGDRPLEGINLECFHENVILHTTPPPTKRTIPVIFE